MRPRFGVALGAGALFVTSAAGLFAEMQRGRYAAARTPEEEAYEDRAREALGWREVRTESGDRLRAARGVRIVVPATGLALRAGHGTVTAGPPPRADVLAATELVAQELALYPASWLARIGLRNVVLCEGLAEDGRAIPSLPNVRESLLVDVSGAPAYLQRLVHHEIFHFADVADDGQLLSDRAWEALNAPGFRYLGSGRGAREPEPGWPWHDAPGFVSRYATSALEEDKAELFALMMVAPRRAAELAMGDPVLATKVAALRDHVASIGSELDERFWERLAAVRVD
ncbi:MAG: hypothetical protein IT373_25120 [Polyangiaceae bacterium]|nr:hypothetical protein [Polyangiaceae bacterium]